MMYLNKKYLLRIFCLSDIIKEKSPNFKVNMKTIKILIAKINLIDGKNL